MRYRTSRVNTRFIRDQLIVSLWFIPVVMSLGAIALAQLMMWVDGLVTNAAVENSSLILASNPGELRNLLLGMAGIVLSTTGIVFSLFTVPLSTVATQYGSRLLRLFQSDRTAQIVLGMFVSTFVYSLTVAFSIPKNVALANAPLIAASVNVLLMIATFGSLIVLIQHISTGLQAPNIAADAGKELIEVIRANGKDRLKMDAETTPARQTPPSPLTTEEISEAPVENGYSLHAPRAGYIQYIDQQKLLAVAVENDIFIKLMQKPGNYVGPGTKIAVILPPVEGNSKLDKAISRAIHIGNLRTPAQDILCAVNQLVEMALRAMSPAINDPFTAMTCLDYLGDGIALFIRQGEIDPLYFDRDGKLRLHTELVSLEEILNNTFDMLRYSCRDNAQLLLHMLNVIDGAGRETTLNQVRQILLRQVELIRAESTSSSLIEQDRQVIQKAVEKLKDKLKMA